MNRLKPGLSLGVGSIATLVALLAVGSVARAQQEIEKVDSVLDRLEKRIIEEEGAGLTFGEKSLTGSDDEGNGAKIKIKGSPARVSGELPEAKKLRDIASGIAQLESEIDQLSSEVQRTRQKIMEEARVDNMVLIETLISGKDTASLKMLRVKLDGYVIYSVSEESGLWLPAKSVPLYSGPLQPGSHRLDFEARIAVKESTSLPLNSDVSRFVSQSFDLRIPDGRQTTKYTVTIDPDTNSAGKASAKIDEATLRSLSTLPTATPPQLSKSVEIKSDAGAK